MRPSFETTLLGLSLLIVVLILSPLELAFVVSGSMTPVLQPNSDLFVVDKSVDTVDQYEEGDIVTFYSENNQRLTTHRVIDRTSDGLITQGDDSFQTDQERGDPPINDELIRGKALMFSGGVFTIPNLAPLAILFNDYTREILFILLVALLLTEFFNPNKRRVKRGSNITVFKLVFVVSVFLVLLWTGVIYLSSITLSGSNIVVTDPSNAQSSQFAQTGEVITRTQQINTESVLPSYDEYRILNDQMDIENIKRQDSQVIVNFTAGPYQERTVRNPLFRIYTYPLTLPPELIGYLHRIHPLLASLGTLSVIAIPMNLLTLVITDNTRIRLNRIRGLRDMRLFNNR